MNNSQEQIERAISIYGHGIISHDLRDLMRMKIELEGLIEVTKK